MHVYIKKRTVCPITVAPLNLGMLHCTSPLHCNETDLWDPLRPQADRLMSAPVQTCKIINVAAMMASINVVSDLQSEQNAQKNWTLKSFNVRSSI